MNTEKTIMQRASLGLPLNNMLVIDGHAHMGETVRVHCPFGDTDGILTSMDKVGIRLTCISHMLALGADYRYGNDIVAKAVRDYPGRYEGYAVINPNYPDDIENELARCLDQLGLWAVKIHPSGHEYPPDGPAYQRVYEFMQERKGVVLSHTFLRNLSFGGKAQPLDALSAQYPDVTFIQAHWGGGFSGRLPSEVITLLRERENVFVDTVASPVPFGGIERLVEQAGPDRIIFGSDVPFVDNAHQIGRITHARISELDKLKILGLNMKSILERAGVHIA